MNTIWEDFDGKPRRKTRRGMGYEQGFADAKAQFEPKWIPISSGKLPKDEQRAVILLKDGRTYSADFYFGNSEWWFEIDNGREYHSLVKAWMPLPEPYKEESEEV